MKNKFFLSSLLIMNVTIYTMEDFSSEALCKIASQALETEYTKYAINKLEEYKKNGHIDMNELVEMGHLITRPNNPTKQLLHQNIKDQNQNHFIHIATEKSDTSTVDWLFKNDDQNFIHMNAHREYPIDVCIKQLSPSAFNSNARPIFDLIVRHTAKLSESKHDDFKQLCLKKIIKLQLDYAKCGQNFIVDEELLQSLIPKTVLAQQPSFLSMMYQEITDEDGNTLSSIIAKRQLENLQKKINWLSGKY
jgi:hypothetical protein